MEVKRISNLDELAGLRAEWNALGHGAPFLSAEWLLTWWKHYGQPINGPATAPELFVLAVVDEADSRLIGIAPWYVQPLPRRGRVVRFLGSGEVCTDYLTVLCHAENQAAVAEALADWLLTEQHTPANAWDQLELTGVDATDPAVSLLIEKLNERGALVHQRPGLATWRLNLPASWDDYLKLLSKSHRKQLRRFERDMLATGRAVLHTVRNRAELAKAWEIFVDLHQRRRATLGQPGCFASPQYADFQLEAASELLEAGKLRLHWLSLDGRPAAAEYHLGGDGIIYAYQAGVEPELLESEPGRVITIAILQDAMAQGYEAFDLLRGAEPYKAHWRAEPRAALEINVLPGHFADHLRFGIWRAKDHVKSWLKQRLGHAALAAEATDEKEPQLAASEKD